MYLIAKKDYRHWSQSLINQGNILTFVSKSIKSTKKIKVAIPYKSGKYSYFYKNNNLAELMEKVAIPYKSGKYSYERSKNVRRNRKFKMSRNPL